MTIDRPSADLQISDSDQNSIKDITIVGCGHMGGALVKGLLDCSWGQEINLRVIDEKVVTPPIQDTRPYEVIASWNDWGDRPLGAIILCVKPQDLSRVSGCLIATGKLQEATVLISILAGVSLEKLGHQTGFNGAIIRAMPNIAARVHCAATAFAGNKFVTESIQLQTKRLFSCIGDAHWVKEELLDAVTGLSGSGPAYIYMVIEALTDGGVHAGLPRALARDLATQTVLGAAKMVKDSGIHPAILREEVTTPSGTTISACVDLEAKGLRSMFVNAVVVATERSRYLGRQ